MIGDVVQTAEELAELPMGTIARTNGGNALLVISGDKVCVTCWGHGGAADMTTHLPAVVLYEPDEL